MVERVDLSIGQTINNQYTISKCLGEGAFGKVFKVTDHANRVFALKLLKLWEVHPEIREQLIARFDMEFQTGQIQSPYLVHSIDHGIICSNPFIVMEFCPNGDLTQLNRSADWILIAQQILLGLKALHSCGKVHRDIKPENVLIKQDGTAALTDFGIAGDRNKRMTERNILGKPMQIFGTYAYMPPEQVRPQRGDATVLPTTDIFSFGVMIYQLLTGNLPFGPLNNENDLVIYINNAKEGKWNRAPLTLTAIANTFRPVIEGCLCPDFKQRLQSADQVLQLLPATKLQTQDFSYKPPQNIQGLILRIMQGEQYGKTYNLTQLQQQYHIITIGRDDPIVNNVIPIQENQSTYISRKHCTLEYDSQNHTWFIRDGQWDTYAPNGWKNSLNGTFVGSKQVSQNGFFLQLGDIISIGDTKLRLEAY